MKTEIKSWRDSNVIFSCEAENIREAVMKAINQKVDLSYANLSYADLSYADLRFVKGTFTFNFGVKLKVVARKKKEVSK